MKKWQIERLVSLNVPFLERKTINTKPANTGIIHSLNCCSIILNTYELNFVTEYPVLFYISCSFRNSYYKTAAQVFTEQCDNNNFESLIYFYNNDCNNLMDINIAIHVEDGIHFFSKQIMLCKKLQKDKTHDKTMEIYEDIYFTENEYRIKGTRCIKIGFNIFSTKQDNDIHFYNETIENNNECLLENQNLDNNYLEPKNLKKQMNIIYNDKKYSVDEYRCILCDKMYFKSYDLRKHTFFSHLYHKLDISDDNCYFMYEKSPLEISYSKLTGFVYLNKATLKILDNDNSRKKHYEKKLYFVKVPYRRRRTEIHCRIPKRSYINEIMIGNDKHSTEDWLLVQKKAQISEYVDIENEKMKIINFWNNYFLKLDYNLNKYNICENLIKFMENIADTKNMFEFLIGFYQKKQITQDDLCKIIEEVLLSRRR